jgi:hypothetical protein
MVGGGGGEREEEGETQGEAGRGRSPASGKRRCRPTWWRKGGGRSAVGNQENDLVVREEREMEGEEEGKGTLSTAADGELWRRGAWTGRSGP